MPYRILIADPHKTVRIAAQMVFAKDPDVILSTAINPYDALDKIHLSKIDLAFMDPQFTQTLKTHLSKLPCPIFDLIKPFNSEGLRKQIHETAKEIFLKSPRAMLGSQSPQTECLPQ